MSENALLERTFNIIMNRLVESGQAPHYTEIAADSGVSMEEGRKTIHDLFSAGVSTGFFRIQILSHHLHPSTISPPSIESPLTVIKNGSLNEDLKR